MLHQILPIAPTPTNNHPINHKKYPIKADFKGISLSTSLNEHIRVDFEPKNNAVYLE